MIIIICLNISLMTVIRCEVKSVSYSLWWLYTHNVGCNKQCGHSLTSRATKLDKLYNCSCVTTTIIVVYCELALVFTPPALTKKNKIILLCKYFSY